MQPTKHSEKFLFSKRKERLVSRNYTKGGSTNSNLNNKLNIIVQWQYTQGHNESYDTPWRIDCYAWLGFNLQTTKRKLTVRYNCRLFLASKHLIENLKLERTPIWDKYVGYMHIIEIGLWGALTLLNNFQKQIKKGTR